MIVFYAKYRKEKPEQSVEDWGGLAAVRRNAGAKTAQ